jgi:hypothetical protein
MKGGDKGNYDAVARRGPVEPDFSFAEKIVVPKIFNNINNSEAQKNLPAPAEKKKPSNRKKSMDNIRNNPHSNPREIPSFKPKPYGKEGGKNLDAHNINLYLDQLEIIRKIVNDEGLNDHIKVSQIAELLDIGGEKKGKIKQIKSDENLKKMEEDDVL